MATVNARSRDTRDDLNTVLTSATAADGTTPGHRDPLPTTQLPHWQPRSGEEIAGRYQLLELLGRGGYGEVWTARDRVLGETVALKWLHQPDMLRSARARREIAVLRMLRMPGVVRLIDEGVAHGCAFVVMEVVPGTPFPGALGEEHDPATAPWTVIAPAALSLLEVLSRVHARGVVHLDLKPANVLVEETGSAVLLDFGISHWSETDNQGRRGFLGGTPAYMAPEQREGGVVDSRADLYAVGVMIFEALTGERPSETSPVAPNASHIPTTVVTVIARLLSKNPKDRPRSAEDVIAALGEVLPERASHTPQARQRRRRTRPYMMHELRAFFAGPDRIFHLREDAAHQLWERTRGATEQIDAELDAWVRLGIARPTKEGYAVEPSGLVRLRYLRSVPDARRSELPDKPLDEGLSETHVMLSLAVRPLSPRVLADALGLSEADTLARCAALVEAHIARRVGDCFETVVPAALDDQGHAHTRRHRALADALEPSADGRLYHLIAAFELSAAAAEALALGRRLAIEGDLAGARAALLEGLSTLRNDSTGRQHLEDAILGELTKVAFAEATPIAYDLTLYELSRVTVRRPHVEALVALVRAAPRVLGPSSADEISRLPVFADMELMRRRNHLRVLPYATRTDPANMAITLEETRRWAEASGHRLARLCLAEGTAFLRYAEGEFAAAAVAHLEAAALDPWATGQIASSVNAASSLLEAYEHRAAEKRARQARKLAAQHRHFYSEARAEWVVRTAKYRAGQHMRPDLELVWAVERLGVPGLHALVCLTEAAVAFRVEDAETTRDLAAIAHRAWSELGRKWGALFVRSLGIRAGALATSDDILRLAEEMLACPVPGAAIQALGLLAPMEPQVGLQFAWAVPGLLAPIPPRHRDLRMDILSANEAARAILEG